MPEHSICCYHGKSLGLLPYQVDKCTSCFRTDASNQGVCDSGMLKKSISSHIFVFNEIAKGRVVFLDKRLMRGQIHGVLNPSTFRPRST